MTIETALYPTQLNATLPPQSDIVREGAGHLRLLKTVVKTTFPNVAGAVSASQVELNYVTGVTSGIQAQIATKGAIAGQTWTGAHSFAGATSVPTLAAGSNTTGAASTAFVQAAFLQKFPNYTTPVYASTAELNYLVGLTGAIQPQLSNQVSGPIHAATAKSTPADADEVGITDSAASWGLKKLTFANLKAWIGGLFVSKSGDTMTGGLSLPTNGLSVGTNQLVVSGGNVGINTGLPAGKLHVTDSAADRAMIFRSGGLDFVNAVNNAFSAINFQSTLFTFQSGSVLLSGGALGYGIGSGGTVTQATSKITAVTLNKPSGRVTMNASALAAGATVQFTINNSFVANTDSAVVGLNGNAVNTNNYEVNCVGTITGTIVVNLRNTSAGSLSDAVQINFAVIKGATS